jgi:general secretion pathway protein H
MLRATRPRQRGFTLIELMVVVALIAVASAMISLSLRDPSASQLDKEASRLVALLESARAQARASGMAVRWEPRPPLVDGGPSSFRFVGLPAAQVMPSRWLAAGVYADVIGARVVVLGPEPIIGPQRIILRLEAQRLVLSTDGLGPFAIADDTVAAAQ